MAGYDEDNVPVPGEAIDNGAGYQSPNKVADDDGKISQEQANYRRGTPVQHCGVCMYFSKLPDNGNAGACTKVEGVISGYGLSDAYAEAANPFGPTLGPRERAVVDEMSQTGPDQSRYGQGVQGPAPGYGIGAQPGMRIGRQAY